MEKTKKAHQKTTPRTDFKKLTKFVDAYFR
mgnify:FL=1